MNFENMNLLSQKVESVLATVRNLRAQVSTLQKSLQDAKDDAQDKATMLEMANRELTDCKAALDARANQASAQNDAMNELRNKMEAINIQIGSKDGIIEKLNKHIAEMSTTINDLRSEINDKASHIEALDAQIEEKDHVIQTQGEEIAEAQERFKQLLSTIENELGTEIVLDQTESQVANETLDEDLEEELQIKDPGDFQIDDNIVEESLEETMATATTVQEEQTAEEKDNDLFSASNGGSQNTFFG